jgi:protein ImuA
MSSAETVARLRERLRHTESEYRGSGDEVSLGAGWDGLFPQGGLRRGTLVEWLSAAEGGSTEAVSFGLASRLVANGGTLVVVDSERTFFPPAAIALGMNPSSIVLVRPRDDREALWAFDQALRSPAVSIVWGRMERLPGRAYRRLQLSAEEGGTIGFLSRSVLTRSQAAWCETSVVVRPRLADASSLGFETEIVRSRDGTTGWKKSFAWTADATIPHRLADSHGSYPVRVVSEMGSAAAARPIGERRTGNAS